MKFTKLHGIGNDYLFINTFVETVKDPAALSVAMSERHFGAGSDGIILVCPPEADGDFRMRMFNADGSEAEMCGNGLRCFAKYVRDREMTTEKKFKVETGAGTLTVEVFLDNGEVQQVEINMGEPDFSSEAMGMEGSGPAEDTQLEVNGRKIKFAFASMGNPHAVTFVENLDEIQLAVDGPVVENNPLFRNRTNVHFVKIHSPAEFTMATWERGSGITLACGTGASAVAAVGIKKGMLEQSVLAHLPGGDLTLFWEGPGTGLFLTGPAEEVYTGDWPQ